MRSNFKIYSIFFALCCFRLYAFSQPIASSYIYKENKSGEQDRAITLKDALSELEDKYNAKFFYQSDLVDGFTIKVQSIESNSSNIEEELASLLRPFDLGFKKGGDKFYVIINKKEGSKDVERLNGRSSISSANNIELASLVHLPVSLGHNPNLKTLSDTEIKGKVTDANGAPIPGVNIRVKDTNVGTTTDSEGAYTLVVPEGNGILVFSYIGYTTEEISISGKSVIDIALIEDLEALQEVVVVGYGTMKKGSVTGAITNMNVEKLEERPLARVDQALVGQMAGVTVKQTSGSPGKAFSIQIRGAGSISAGNEPLYVIDGFPLASANPNGSGNYATGNPLDNINPNDIESIQVLKDASAAAIYGSRASNGVVVITTKKGKQGKATLSFNAYTGFIQANRRLDVLNGDQWIERAIEVIDAQWAASAKTGRTTSQTNEERRVILGLKPGEINPTYMVDERWLEPGHPGLEYVDWQDRAFRVGAIQNYQLSASGGNEFVKYYISGNYNGQDGIVIGTGYTNYSARANVEVAASKKLKFGINISPTYSITKDPGVEGKDNILHQLATFTPIQEAGVGDYANVFDKGQYRWSVSPNSPIAKLKNAIGQTTRFRTLSTAYLDLEIIKGLNFRTTVNLDNTDNASKSYTPYTVAGTLLSRQTQPGVNSSGSYSGFRNQTFVNENTLTYNKIFLEKHNVSLLAGASYNSYKLDNVRLSSTGGFNTNTFNTLNGATGIAGPGSSNTTETKSILLSYFGRLQYSFDDKYLFSASIRRDGSSRFGANTKWGLFPSASVGWRVSGEKFMEQFTFLSDLKLRASWGKSGNNNIGDYSSIPVLGFYNYSFGGTAATGQAPSRAANPDLTWEKSETINAGIDLGFFQNRIVASFEYYTKKNTDLLLNVPTPQVTGYPISLTNVGEVRNKGWEIEVNTRNITGRFEWNTSINFSHNENEVVKLGPGATSLQIPSSFDIPHSILKIGEPMYSIYAVKQIGIITAEDSVAKIPMYGSQTVGDPKYFDYSGDGVIDANDRMIVGKPNPTYIWGLTNTFKYMGFDLTILVQGQTGGSIYSLFGRAIDRTGMGYLENTIAAHNDRWRSSENPGAGVKGKAYSNFGRIKNTDWLYSSDYWRIRNITLGYNLNNLFKAKFIQVSRIYLTAENYFGKDRYTGGFNPEATNTNLSGDDNYPEAGDYGGLPLPKSMIIGLNLTF